MLEGPTEMWMQVGCKVYMDSYMASHGSCFMVTWIIFINHFLELGLTQNQGDRDIPNAHEHWFIWFYHVGGSAWIDIHWNSTLLTLGPLTFDFTLHLRICDYTTWFWRFLETILDTSFWALTIWWLRLLDHVWSDPKGHFSYRTKGPYPLHFKHSHRWKRWRWSIFASNYVWGTNLGKEMQDGCKVYMDSYMASNGSCFVFLCIVFQNHLLEVGLIEKARETMGLWNHTIVIYQYFFMCGDPTFIENHWNSVWLRARSHMTLHYTRGPVTILHDFGSGLGWPLDPSFALLQFCGHSSWLMCEVAQN
jgi:hypothetical protein